MVWISNYVHVKRWDVITHAVIYSNGGLVSPPKNFNAINHSCPLYKFNHVSKSGPSGAASLISKGRHVDNLLVSGGTGGCRSGNFRYSQWREGSQNDYILVSVLRGNLPWYKTYIKLWNLQQNRRSLSSSQSIITTGTYVIDRHRMFGNVITKVTLWSVKSMYPPANPKNDCANWIGMLYLQLLVRMLPWNRTRSTSMYMTNSIPWRSVLKTLRIIYVTVGIRYCTPISCCLWCWYNFFKLT